MRCALQRNASTFANLVLLERNLALDALIGRRQTAAKTRTDPELILSHPRNEVRFQRKEDPIEGVTG
jgi:hypothetical protein